MKVVKNFHNFDQIQESLGDGVKNFISKVLGGDISKLNNQIFQMRILEEQFIDEEHDLMSKYIRLKESGIKLSKYKDLASKEAIQKVNKSLYGLYQRILILAKSYQNDLNIFQNQAESLTHGNPRKIAYYNVRRAEDSVETKRMRWESWKELIRGLDPESLEDLNKTFQQADTTSDKVEMDYKRALGDIHSQNQRTAIDILKNSLDQ